MSQEVNSVSSPAAILLVCEDMERCIEQALERVYAWEAARAPGDEATDEHIAAVRAFGLLMNFATEGLRSQGPVGMKAWVEMVQRLAKKAAGRDLRWARLLMDMSRKAVALHQVPPPRDQSALPDGDPNPTPED